MGGTHAPQCWMGARGAGWVALGSELGARSGTRIRTAGQVHLGFAGMGSWIKAGGPHVAIGLATIQPSRHTLTEIAGAPGPDTKSAGPRHSESAQGRDTKLGPDTQKARRAPTRSAEERRAPTQKERRAPTESAGRQTNASPRHKKRRAPTHRASTGKQKRQTQHRPAVSGK